MDDKVVHVIPAKAGIQVSFPRRRESRLVGPRPRGDDKALCIAIATLALAACTAKPADDALFPLGAGHHWTYRVTTALDAADPRRHQQTIHARGSELLGDVPAWRRHSDDGIDYWLRADDTGIYRVAVRGALDRAPRKDAERRYVLQKPYAVGTEWQATTTAYVLQRTNEVPREVSRTHPSFPMHYRIEALDQKVETPAGRFDGCLRVHGKAEIRLYVDEKFAWREIPLFTTEWYCPNVGLVKLDRHEPSPTKFITGGHLTMELTGWH